MTLILDSDKDLQLTYSINLFKKGILTEKQIGFFLHLKFSQKFIPLGNHMSNYVNTLKNLKCHYHLKHPVESKETLSKTYVAGSCLVVICDNL